MSPRGFIRRATVLLAAAACFAGMLFGTALASATISGTVVTPPVPYPIGMVGTPVSALDAVTSETVATTAAGSYGVYHLLIPDGHPRVKVRFGAHWGYATTWWQSQLDFASATTVTITPGEDLALGELVMSEGLSVDGTVSTLPSSHARVDLHAFLQVGSVWTEAPSATGADGGAYHLQGLSPGTYHILASGSDVLPTFYTSVVATDPAAPGCTDVTVALGATRTVDFSLTRGGHIVGTITRPTGHPAIYPMERVRAYAVAATRPNHPVSLTAAEYQDKTLDMGLLVGALGNPLTSAGDYKIYVESSDMDLKPTWYGADSYAAATPVHVTDGADSAPISIPLRVWPFTVANATCASTVARQASLSTFGTLLPLQPAGQRGVVVTYDRFEGGKWVYKGATPTSCVYDSSKRRWHLDIRFGMGGQWRIRVKHRDAGHSKTVYSAGYAYVTVY